MIVKTSTIGGNRRFNYMNYIIAFHLICTSIILIISEINGGK